jgi:hypothetical protein
VVQIHFPLSSCRHHDRGATRPPDSAGFMIRRAALPGMVPLQFGVPGGIESLILGLVALVVPFVLAYWV